MVTRNEVIRYVVDFGGLLLVGVAALVFDAYVRRANKRDRDANAARAAAAKPQP